MRSDLDSGRPPRYMSLSRSRISLPSGELKGMLRLLTEIDPTEAETQHDRTLEKAHIDQQVQIALQQLHGEVIGLQLPTGLLLFGTLRTSVAEQQEAAGLRGSEMKDSGVSKVTGSRAATSSQRNTRSPFRVILGSRSMASRDSSSLKSLFLYTTWRAERRANRGAYSPAASGWEVSITSAVVFLPGR
ncbi:hypothetical protein EYF80_035670 [Liparis tanakae]|uniref:Uncharacterized protein n=1 Tax=Liparis tanakae TaxID=230148 RepID=A0A4Z2GLK6_9TELE|nr:hypothetical protein EYF80_035670 [Liparis tanakae]